MRTVALIYPHHLYVHQPVVAGADAVWLVEEPLFFSQYHFHAQKLMYHRATMRRYRDEHLPQARYVAHGELPTTETIVTLAKDAGCTHLQVLDPNDDWLLRRLQAACTAARITLVIIDDPHFLTPPSVLQNWKSDQTRLPFSPFYREQRQRLGLLMNDDGPAGGQWSFDTENRRRLPATVALPTPAWPEPGPYAREAQEYVQANFPQAIGSRALCRYPTSATEAQTWLQDFFEHRFRDFGAYEDAMTQRSDIVFHSVLTPMLNTGLLTPRQVIDGAMTYADRVPMNSLEGFVRQVIGWREFVRLVYRRQGRAQRTKNFWRHDRRMPAAFYTAQTGLDPVDRVVAQVLETGYCHHIERLMILGNCLLLCRVNPDEVYRWFMEMFIDAYDWVMVPNVYGMSQYADGGGMTTKPYISGSAYVLRMSDTRKGPWCAIWDALYWTFIADHRDVFAHNHRLAMMARLVDRLGPTLTEHRRRADAFLSQLHH